MTRQDMDYNEIIDQLTWKIIDFDKGDPKRIQHLLKVHRFAQLIARAEHVDEHTRQVLECAAVLHDVGIHPAEAKYGRCDGKLQEQGSREDLLAQSGVFAELYQTQNLTVL